MLSSVASQSKVDLRPLRALQQKLLESFDTEFDLWVFDGAWRQLPTSDDAEGLPAPEPFAARLEATRAPNAAPICLDAGDGESCLLLPLPRHQRRWVAASARFRGESARMLLRLGRLFVTEFNEQNELERLRHEHQAFLRQVTNDFEELTFLRSMSRLLEISDLSFDFLAMAGTMLPTLKPLLDTDLLVVVPAGDNGRPEVGSTLSTPAFDPNNGEQCMDDQKCCRLVEIYRELVAVQPVVKNHFERLPQSAEFPGLHSFIIVPIVNGNVTIGWLLALNRNNERNLNTQEVPWEISYLEFGTHEATLMSSSAAILATHARNVDLFREREELLVSVVRALVSAIEAKDEYTRGHSERVALYGKRIAEELGYDGEFCERLYLTGLLHDVGKIGVRDAVLRKPGPLTDEEFEEIKQHPDKGWQILCDLEPLSYVLDGVLHHHEQVDGSGYPDNLAGDKIPLDGRILAVADAYDAMTSDRPYRHGMPQEKAESILRAGSGKQWDTVMVDAIFRCMPDVLRIKKEYEPRATKRRKSNNPLARAGD